MKQDYLWDRTGNDPEIERLEEVLSVLRYQERTASALPATVNDTFVQTVPKRRIFLAFAFATSFIAVTVGTVWFQVSYPDVSSEKAVVSHVPDHGEKTISPSGGLAFKTANTITATRAKSVRSPRALRPVLVAVKPDPRRQNDVKLTREERYAYGQLLLALSITGSKLRIVQDRVNGVEDSKRTLNENNRIF